MTASSAVVLSALALAAPADADIDDLDFDCTGPALATPPNHDPNTAPVAVADTATVITGGAVVIDVVGNDTDADDDELTLVSVETSRTSEAYACIDQNQIIFGSGEEPRSGTEKLTYAVTDGDYYRTGTVTVSYADVTTAKPVVQRKLEVTRGKVTKQAKVVFSNPDSTYPIHVFAGDFEYEDEPQEIVLQPGESKSLLTKRKRLDFVSFVSEDNAAAVVQAGDIRTLTGKVRAYEGFFYEDYRFAAKATDLARRAQG